MTTEFESINVLKLLDGFIDGQCIFDMDKAVLIETDQGAKLSRVTLCNIPKGSLVVPIDDIRTRATRGRRDCRVVSLLREDARSKAHCLVDYLILAPKSCGTFDCYLVDLKSVRPKGFAIQFLGAQCLVKYLESFMELQHAKPMCIARTIYVILQFGADAVKLPFGEFGTVASSPTVPIRVFRQNEGKVYFRELSGRQ